MQFERGQAAREEDRTLLQPSSHTEKAAPPCPPPKAGRSDNTARNWETSVNLAHEAKSREPR